MKFLISLTVLLSQWNLTISDPGIVEVSPEFRRSRGDKTTISTKLSSFNSITDDVKTTTVPPTTSNFQSFKITADDVVTGSNAVYGSHAQFQNGGIIYAISQGQGSTGQPLLPAAPPQPVLMQYLSPEGTPQQTAVQYIQLLRPFMMVPATPYMPAKPNTSYELDVKTTLPVSSSPKPFVPVHNPYRTFSNYPLVVGSYSSPQNSYFQTNPRLLEKPKKPSQSDMGLNMNEYMPSASSQHMSVLAPRSSMIGSHSHSPYAFNPTKFQTRAQRA